MIQCGGRDSHTRICLVQVSIARSTVWVKGTAQDFPGIPGYFVSLDDQVGGGTVQVFLRYSSILQDIPWRTFGVSH